MAKKKIGRPPFKIDKEVLRKVEGYASRGMNQDQVADALGINRKTLMKYKQINSDFMDAMKVGQAKGIAQVTNALFEQSQKGNTSAAIFYLKNRAGWTDKQDVELSGEIKVKTMDDLYI